MAKLKVTLAGVEYVSEIETQPDGTSKAVITDSLLANSIRESGVTPISLDTSLAIVTTHTTQMVNVDHDGKQYLGYLTKALGVSSKHGSLLPENLDVKSNLNLTPKITDIFTLDKSEITKAYVDVDMLPLTNNDTAKVKTPNSLDILGVATYSSGLVRVYASTAKIGYTVTVAVRNGSKMKYHTGKYVSTTATFLGGDVAALVVPSGIFPTYAENDIIEFSVGVGSSINDAVITLDSFGFEAIGRKVTIGYGLDSLESIMEYDSTLDTIVCKNNTAPLGDYLRSKSIGSDVGINLVIQGESTADSDTIYAINENSDNILYDVRLASSDFTNATAYGIARFSKSGKPNLANLSMAARFNSNLTKVTFYDIAIPSLGKTYPDITTYPTTPANNGMTNGNAVMQPVHDELFNHNNAVTFKTKIEHITEYAFTPKLADDKVIWSQSDKDTDLNFKEDLIGSTDKFGGRLTKAKIFHTLTCPVDAPYAVVSLPADLNIGGSAILTDLYTDGDDTKVRVSGITSGDTYTLEVTLSDGVTETSHICYPKSSGAAYTLSNSAEATQLIKRRQSDTVTIKYRFAKNSVWYETTPQFSTYLNKLAGTISTKKAIIELAPTAIESVGMEAKITCEQPCTIDDLTFTDWAESVIPIELIDGVPAIDLSKSRTLGDNDATLADVYLSKGSLGQTFNFELSITGTQVVTDDILLKGYATAEKTVVENAVNGSLLLTLKDGSVKGAIQKATVNADSDDVLFVVGKTDIDQ